MPVYKIKPKGCTPIIVTAANKQAAVAHVAKRTIEAETLTSEQVAAALVAGAPHETARAEAEQETLPLEGEGQLDS